jgi:hypothetical protein
MSLLHKTALDISLIFIRNNVPNDISFIVFNFLEEDIKQQENKKYLSNKVKQFVNRDSHEYKKYYIIHSSDMFTFHFNELPYFKYIDIDDKERIKKAIICSLNAITNKKYKFTNYCCGGKGIVIEPIKQFAQCSLVYERH